MDKSKHLLSKCAFVFLLPVFFVWHGFVQNYPLVPASDALKLVFEYLAIALLLAVLSYFVFKSWQKALLFTFLLMCIQFFFGAVHDLLKTWFPNSFIAKYSFLLSLILVITAAIFLVILKTRRSFKKMTNYLSITLVILIAVDLAVLFSKLITRSKATTPNTGITSCNNCKTPNIYLIITDEYAGRKELRDLFSFDNSAFQAELEKRDFHVVKNPMSNYNFTPYSMASIFDMNYLKGITSKANDIHNRNVSLETINNNTLVATLKSFGYDFVNLSVFDFAGKAGVSSNEFYSTHERLISSQTLTGRIKKDLWYHFVTTFKLRWAQNGWQKDLINIFEREYNGTLMEAKDPERPRFVYTHFIMPHYPYLFDRNGNQLSFEESQQDGRKDLYLEYLQYCNKQCLVLVDSILKRDKTEPIIVLMSDHGFTKYDPSAIDPSYNFNNVLNIYIPRKNYSEFPDSMSNVNLFRVILNKQFNQRLPFLKDSTIFLEEY
jgi:hypothetical protein